MTYSLIGSLSGVSLFLICIYAVATGGWLRVGFRPGLYAAFFTAVAFVATAIMAYEFGATEVKERATASARFVDADPVVQAQLDHFHQLLKYCQVGDLRLGLGIDPYSAANIGAVRVALADCAGRALNDIAVLNGVRAKQLAGLLESAGLPLPAQWEGQPYDRAALVAALN